MDDPTGPMATHTAESEVVQHDMSGAPVMHQSAAAPVGGVVNTIAEVEATVQATSMPAAGSIAASTAAAVLGLYSDPNNPPAKQLRPGRQGKQVPRWTPEEEEKLKMIIGDGDPKGKWQEIAEQMGTERSAMSVEQHW